MDASTLGAKIAAKELSSAEVTRACLDRIAETDGQYQAFLHVAEEQALAAAAQVDAAVAAGEELPSPLAGVPLALKDVFTTTDMPTTCGSKILAGMDVALRRDRHGAAACRGHPDPGQDQHGRIRDGVVHRELGLRPDPQSVGRRAGARRIRRRQRGGAGRVPGAAGHRLGHRRFNPPARGADRDRRRQTHLRHGVALWPDGLRVVAGPGRAVRPHGARHRLAAPRDRRARPEGLDLAGRRGARHRRGGQGGRRRRPARRQDRCGPPVARRRLPGRRARVVQRRGRETHRTRGRGVRSGLPALRLLAARRTT